MAALNVSFTDEEMALLRTYAARHDLSLKAAVKHAVQVADRHDLITKAAIEAARINAGLSRRLADQ